MQTTTLQRPASKQFKRSVAALAVAVLLITALAATMGWWAVLMVSISACIGWGTNFIAVKMLFHPKTEKKFGLLSIQGIFPRRQHLIAENVARIVAEELIATEEVKMLALQPHHLDVIRRQVNARVSGFLEHTMPQHFPLLSMVLSKRMKESMKTTLLLEVDEKLPGMVSSFMDYFEGQVDMESMIRTKFAALSSDELESVMYDMLREEFRFIEWVGLTIGLLIGLVQVLITWHFVLPN